MKTHSIGTKPSSGAVAWRLRDQRHQLQVSHAHTGKLTQTGQSKALDPNDGDHNPEACPEATMPY